MVKGEEIVEGGEQGVAPSPALCKWVQELYRGGVVRGCAAGLCCPTSAANRQQMGVFIGQGFGLSLYGP